MKAAAAFGIAAFGRAMESSSNGYVLRLHGGKSGVQGAAHAAVGVCQFAISAIAEV
jgi:hypothetical protein